MKLYVPLFGSTESPFLGDPGQEFERQRHTQTAARTKEAPAIPGAYAGRSWSRGALAKEGKSTQIRSEGGVWFLQGVFGRPERAPLQFSYGL
jgi:hypothetical protein